MSEPLSTPAAQGTVALLPCPFCGGKADHHDIGNEHTRTRSTKIWCTSCYFAKNVKAIRHSLDWTRRQAIEAWNRRASPSPEALPASGVEAEHRLNAIESAMLEIAQAADPNGFVLLSPDQARDLIANAKAFCQARGLALTSAPAPEDRSDG